MSLELFEKILDSMGNHLVKVVLYAWGEPLLNENIYDMVRLSQDRNIGTMISTNLNTFRKRDTEKLFWSGLEHLIVSVDGMTPTAYKKYRKGGDVERVMGNLQHILNEKRRRGKRFPVVEMQYIVFPHNTSETGMARIKARELNVDLLSFLQGQSLDPRERTLSQASKAARQRGCDLLWTSTYINWDGSVSPCCFENDNVFGSVNESPFENIWNGSIYQESRRLSLGRAMQDMEVTQTRCRQCLLQQSRGSLR